MSKAHRGAGVRELPKSGRGDCPVCKRTGVKTLYEIEANSKKVKICKISQHTFDHSAEQGLGIGAVQGKV